MSRSIFGAPWPVQSIALQRRQLDAADDQVNGWSSDGKYILYSSARTTDFPFRWDLYKVPIAGDQFGIIGQGATRRADLRDWTCR